MGDLFVVVAVVGGLAAVMSWLAWQGARMRRRSAGVDVMGPFEEIWHPAAHRARFETQVQEERMVPMPSPDDQLNAIRVRRADST